MDVLFLVSKTILLHEYSVMLHTSINIKGYNMNQKSVIIEVHITFAECLMFKKVPIMHFNLIEFL